MKILLTGGTGFIGRHVIERLIAGGDEVVAVRRPRPSEERPCDDQGVAWRDCHLDDTTTLRELFQETRPDACLHLAWFTETGHYPSAPTNVDLLTASLSLIRIAGEEGCRRFIGVGTCAEYESTPGPLREDSRVNPHTLYGASKLALRYLGEALSGQTGMDFAWTRIFYVYGPREDRRRVVPAVVNTLLDGRTFAATTGEQVRDFLHVEDVASAFVTLCHSPEQGVFNIASGQPTTMRSLLMAIAHEMNAPDGISFGAATKHTFDPPYIVGDVSRLQSLGWRPQYTLRSGLLHTIDWWQHNRLEPVGCSMPPSPHRP
jgi:nucleoside-diphosphate-sugar epimerase